MDLEQYIGKMEQDEMILQLEFISTKCFLTGIRGNLSSGYNMMYFYLNPPSEPFNNWLKEKGQPVRTQDEYREQGEQDLRKVIEGYATLPYEEMDEESPLHKPFFEGMRSVNKVETHLDLLLETFDPQQLQEIEKQSIAIREVGNDIYEVLKQLKSQIKYKTGKDYSFAPNTFIRPERLNQLV